MDLYKRNNRTIAEGALCFWSWNDDLEASELVRQLEEFSRGRFSGVVIHARGGLRIPYMGEEWFRCYRTALDAARRLGLDVWIYDEDGWPSGFAGGAVPRLGEAYWVKRLKFTVTDHPAVSDRLAAWREQDGRYTPIPAETAVEGDLVCRVVMDKNYVDILSPATVQAFINATHERYKQELGEWFGSVIKGVFTDEPQVLQNPWSPALETAWAQRYGSPLKEQLYKLAVPAEGWQSFRAAYYSLVGDLVHDSFTAPISDWCEQNGLLFTGHFAQEDGLVLQTVSNGGVMRQYAAMSMPGIDHLGNRITSAVLCKQLSSVASQCEKPEVLSETLGCAGWELSFDRLCWIWGRQSALGVTKPCFHLAAYSMAGRRKRDYPAFFSYQEPWWEQFPAVMQWVNGLNGRMKEGSRLVDTLILSPLSGTQAVFPTTDAELYSCEYRRLLENLLDLQLDCELGDETLLRQYGAVEGTVLRLGASRYRQVIVPLSYSYTAHTAALLRQFAAAGGRIWYVGQKPVRIDGQPGEYPEAPVVQNRRDMLEKCIDHEGLFRPVLLRRPRDGALKHNALLHTRQLSHGWRVHIWTDTDFCAGETLICLADTAARSVYRVDIATGNRQPLPVWRDGKGLYTTLHISECANLLLETDGTEAAVPPVPVPLVTRRVEEVSVAPAEENALTLDRAAFSIDGDDYTQEQPVIHALTWLYEERERRDSRAPLPVRVKYRFICGEGLELSGITAAVEDGTVETIEVNGVPVETGRQGWWLDRHTGVYAIGGLLRPGENTLVLHYRLPVPLRGTKVDGFESERNRFFYPVEPDSVWLRGAFDVEAPAPVETHGCYDRIPAGDFRLVPPTGKRPGNLTRQGMWFYRGNVQYRFRLPYTGGRCTLRLLQAHGVAARVSVGDKEQILLNLDEEADLTPLLQPGDNEVTVLLLGFNRNLLGPHHHVKGIPALVGPSTFAGTYGFEDFVSPELKRDTTIWVDGYHVIPFGCDGFAVTEYGTAQP